MADVVIAIPIKKECAIYSEVEIERASSRRGRCSVPSQCSRTALFTATRPVGVKMSRETSERLAHELSGNLPNRPYPSVSLWGFPITFDGEMPEGAIEILYASQT